MLDSLYKFKWTKQTKFRVVLYTHNLSGSLTKCRRKRKRQIKDLNVWKIRERR